MAGIHANRLQSFNTRKFLNFDKLNYWFMAKSTMVKLTEKKSGEEREFTITHAQDLLDLEKKMSVSNWELTDSNFVLENGIIKRTNTGDSKESTSEEPANTSNTE